MVQGGHTEEESQVPHREENAAAHSWQSHAGSACGRRRRRSASEGGEAERLAQRVEDREERGIETHPRGFGKLRGATSARHAQVLPLGAGEAFNQEDDAVVEAKCPLARLRPDAARHGGRAVTLGP